MNVLALFFVLTLLAVAVRGDDDFDYKPIPDLQDPHVQEIAKFAVTELGKATGERLKYIKTVKGDYLIDDGTNYRLVITILNDQRMADYLAIVLEKPAGHYTLMLGD
ncbi:hypothetical protein RND81_06G141300 [Saponaria officinalis]|uniref:Cystatin domain-containing protein n=1 Tax=Saponaria officinalis TaxID=3572 RepID=A0AAW1K9P7_SAPOF